MPSRVIINRVNRKTPRKALVPLRSADASRRPSISFFILLA